MLDGAGVVKAQLVSFFRDRERFRVIGRGALVGMVDRRKKLHTELHVAPRSRFAFVGILLVMIPSAL
jgi:hypothetical protein